MYLNHLLRYKPFPTGPALRRIIQHQIKFKPVFLVPGELLQFTSQEDIFLIYICEDKRDLSLVGFVLEDGPDDLQHGCDSRAASDHSECAHQTWSVDHLAFGAFDFDGVANFHETYVL